MTNKISEDIRNFIAEHCDSNSTMVDVLCEYCLKNEMSEEEVGEIVASDKELLNLVKFDLSRNDNLENF